MGYLKLIYLKMRFFNITLVTSSAYALRVNFNSNGQNSGCVTNFNDCSADGNCCANEELCGVQKHSDIFFGQESITDASSNFCDDEYTFYGQIEELKLWCDQEKGQVKGISARHGPKPGESKYAWSMIHGSNNNESEDEKWLLWGHNISEIKIGYSEEMGIQAIQFFYDRSRTSVCGNFSPDNEMKTSTIVFDSEEACKIDYLAGNENEDGGINGLTFHFDCKLRSNKVIK